MSTGAGIQSKIASVLSKVQGTSRVVKFRDSRPTGGNALLGVGQTVTNHDVDITPQPTVELMTPEDIAASGALLQLGDYRFIFDGAITEATLKNSNVVYGTDVLKVVSYNPQVIFGTIVAWTVIARTVKAS
jgi:hypothetical protein